MREALETGQFFWGGERDGGGLKHVRYGAVHGRVYHVSTEVAHLRIFGFQFRSSPGYRSRRA
jgi:hypothetical protein